MTANLTSVEAKSLELLEKAQSTESIGEALSKISNQAWARAKSRGNMSSRTKIKDQPVKSTQSVSRPKDWEILLVTTVCRSLGCVVLWESGQSQNLDYWGKYHVIGDRDNVQLAEYTVVTLLKRILRERTRFRQYLVKNENMSRGTEMSRRINNFCLVWVEDVLSTLPRSRQRANESDVSRAINDKVIEITSSKSTIFNIGKYPGHSYAVRE